MTIDPKTPPGPQSQNIEETDTSESIPMEIYEEMIKEAEEDVSTQLNNYWDNRWQDKNKCTRKIQTITGTSFTDTNPLTKDLPISIQDESAAKCTLKNCTGIQHYHFVYHAKRGHNKLLSHWRKALNLDPANTTYRPLKGSYNDANRELSKFAEYVTKTSKPEDDDVVLQMLDRVEEGATEHELLREFPAQHKKLKYVTKFQQPKKRDVATMFIWGPSGVGKSYAVKLMLDKFKQIHDINYYYKSCGFSKWWQGYTGQEIVVLDDCDIPKATKGNNHDFIKELISSGDFRPEMKYSHATINCQFVIFIHNCSPEEYAIQLAGLDSSGVQADVYKRRIEEYYGAEEVKSRKTALCAATKLYTCICHWMNLPYNIKEDLSDILVDTGNRAKKHRFKYTSFWNLYKEINQDK